MIRMTVRLLTIAILTTFGVAFSNRIPNIEQYNALKSLMLDIGMTFALCMLVAMLIQLALHLNTDHMKDFESIFLFLFTLCAMASGKITRMLSDSVTAFDSGVGLIVALLAAGLLQYLYVRTAFGAGDIHMVRQIDWVCQGVEKPEWLSAFLLSVVAGAVMPVIMMIGSPNPVYLWFGGLYILSVIIMYYLGLRFYTKNYQH